ncbi:MAG: hypothetical protein GY900_10770, partial [Actinomycetia bacterium]|nr:hypothetical protein [Actinomycetes bacterium]
VVVGTTVVAGTAVVVDTTVVAGTAVVVDTTVVAGTAVVVDTTVVAGTAVVVDTTVVAGATVVALPPHPAAKNARATTLARILFTVTATYFLSSLHAGPNQVSRRADKSPSTEGTEKLQRLS